MNRTLSIDREADKIYQEFQIFAMKNGKSPSSLFSEFIKDYVEEADKPIQVMKKISLDFFIVNTEWKYEDWNRLKRTQKIALSIALADRARQSHYFHGKERKEKGLAEGEVFLPKDVPEGPLPELNEEVVEEEVIVD